MLQVGSQCTTPASILDIPHVGALHISTHEYCCILISRPAKPLRNISRCCIKHPSRPETAAAALHTRLGAPCSARNAPRHATRASSLAHPLPPATQSTAASTTSMKRSPRWAEIGRKPLGGMIMLMAERRRIVRAMHTSCTSATVHIPVRRQGAGVGWKDERVGFNDTSETSGIQRSITCTCAAAKARTSEGGMSTSPSENRESCGQTGAAAASCARTLPLPPPLPLPLPLPLPMLLRLPLLLAPQGWAPNAGSSSAGAREPAAAAARSTPHAAQTCNAGRHQSAHLCHRSGCR